MLRANRKGPGKVFREEERQEVCHDERDFNMAGNAEAVWCRRQLSWNIFMVLKASYGPHGFCPAITFIALSAVFWGE